MDIIYNTVFIGRNTKQFLFVLNAHAFYLEEIQNNHNLEELKTSLESDELKNFSMFLIFSSL